MSLLNEYINRKLSSNDLEQELLMLISQYNSYRKTFLIVYAAAIAKPIPAISLNMDDYYVIYDLIRNTKNKTLDFYLETPGGVLILTTPNTAMLQDRLRFVFGIRPRQLDRVNPHLRLHISHSTPASLRKDLESSGFEQFSFKSNLVRWYLPSGQWRDSRKLAQLFPNLGADIIMSARKPI